MAELKSHSGKFFEVSVAMQQTSEEGIEKMVKRTIVVEAMSFGDAERIATEEMMPYCSGELKIVNINPTTYGEVYSSEDDKDDRFYKCKLSFITLNEKTGKEKRTKVTYLVQADTTNKAQRYIDENIMHGSMMDYETCSISETPIEDACFYNGNKE